MNVAQLQSLQEYVDQGWTLSVGGKNLTTVGIKSVVDFSATSDNLTVTITKGEKDNNVKFGLVDNLKVTSVTAGRGSISDDGIVFDGGPRITVDGIDANKKKITGVKAGTQDTDAVNVAQLNKMKDTIKMSWQLSVNGEDAMAIGQNGIVNFVTPGSENNQNIKIVKDDNHNVKFDLADNIKVTRVTAGRSSISDDGIVFDEGPRITVDGINANKKKITGVKAGTQDTDAVNYKQLKEIKDQIDGSIVDVIDSVKSNILVKWDEAQSLITIGKERDGSVINIENKSGESRTISGVKAAKNDDEAVNKKQLDGTIADITDSINVVKEANNFAVLYDKKNDNTVNYKSITLGDKKNPEPVALHNVADGKIVKDSHDAINGSQINKIAGDIANFFGGGTEFKDGAFAGPRYNLSTVSADGNVVQKTIENVGSALTELDANVKNVNSHLTYVADNFTQKIDSVSKDSLLWSNNEQAFVALHGPKDGKTESKLTFLKDGKISQESHDAINGGQIYKISQDVAKFFGGNASFKEGAFSGPKYDLTTIDEDGAVKKLKYSDVGAALDAVNKNVFAVDHTMIIGFNEIADYFGGGAKYEKGKWQAPTFKISQRDTSGTIVEKEYNNVGDVLEGLDTSVKNVNTHLENEVKKFNEKITNISQEVKGDALLWSETDKAFVAQHGAGKTKSKITFLANGETTENSTDAVNGSQLFKMAQNASKYFGGGADVLAGIEPSYLIQNEEYHDIGSAFTGVNISITRLDSKISEMAKTSLVQQEKGASGIITIGKATAGTEISVAGSGGSGRTISGVRAATQDNEAVNKAQLDKSLESLSNTLQSEDSSVVLYDKTTDGKTDYGSVTFGKGEDAAPVALHNVANGEIAKDSHDAVNGSQINKIAEDVAQFLGGGATFSEGIFQKPTYNVSSVDAEGKVTNNSYSDISAVFTGLDTSVKNVNTHLTNEVKKFDEKITNITEGLKGDALLWNDDAQAFVAQHGAGKTKSKIKFLEKGEISESSTEAVNGSQLYSMSNKLATYFGGGASFKNGAFVGPKYSLSTISVIGEAKQKDYDNVGSALVGLNANVKNVNSHLTNVVNTFTEKVNNISKEVKGDALLWNDDAQAFVAQHGAKKTKSKITFLANGEISANSTDAINGSQLYWMSDQLAAYFGGGAKYKDGKWTAPTFKIAQFKGDGSSGEKKSYNNVASAFDGVNESMSSINDRIHDVEQNVASNGLQWNEKKKAYDASHNGKVSRIDNVANGKIAKGSQEVVNGGQLWETNQKVTAVENKVNTIENKVNNIDKHVQDIASAVTDGAVSYDKDADGEKTNKITLAGGDPGEPVMIDNVADGRIEKGSKEAVNGGQLHDYTEQQLKVVLDDAKHYTDHRVNNIVVNAIDDAVDRSNQYTNMKFNLLSYDIKNVRKEARQAAAIGLAVSNLRYFDDPGSLSVSFGSGAWHGQSAFAFGAGYTSEDGKIRSNISATSAGGHWGVGGGITLKLK
ncbi:Vomp family autotransporter [Bartonella gliris]|uniref:Vomp family autotransporter n=1 Tax=Bartonella gliris TaxID=3004109 RepID=UPI00295E40AF|nr:Vomp family autotransporter [Bartonella gliris]